MRRAPIMEPLAGIFRLASRPSKSLVYDTSSAPDPNRDLELFRPAPQRRPSIGRMLRLGLVLAACGGGQPKSAYDVEYARCKRWGGDNVTCDHLATTKQGPGSEVSDARWIGLEAEARSNAKAEGEADVFRMNEVGFVASREIELRGEHCYRIGVGAGEKRKSRLSIVFLPGLDGSRVHDHFRGREFDIPPEGGGGELCVDHDGRANLTLMALSEVGAVLNNTRLQYAVAMVKTPEATEHRDARRIEEKAKAATGRATVCSNCEAAYQRCIADGQPNCVKNRSDCQAGYDCR